MDWEKKKKTVDKKIENVQAEKEAYLSQKTDEEREFLINGQHNNIETKSQKDVFNKPINIKNRLFMANTYRKAADIQQSKTREKNKVFNLNQVLEEVNGFKADSDKKSVIKAKKKLISKIRKNAAEKNATRFSMKKVLDKHADVKPELTRFKGMETSELSGSVKSFKNYAYKKLPGYKSDKDFVKNYEKIIHELNHQIEEGYITRHSYNKYLLDSGHNEDYLKAMAKTATLERVRDYMELRALLISNPYYVLNDTEAIYKLDVRELEMRYDKADSSGNTELALFLHTLISIKYLGFKVDGTGRREIEKQILEENREKWLKERRDVTGLSRITNKIEYYEKLKENFDHELTIEKNKKLEADKKADDEKKKKDKEAADKEKLEKKAKELVKKNRVEWIKKIQENCDLGKFGIDENLFSDIGENILKNLAEGYLKGELDTKDDQNFRAVIANFENRIMQKIQRIRDLVKNDKDFALCAYGMDSRRAEILAYIVGKLIEDNELLKADDKLDRRSFTKYIDAQEFDDKFYDAEIYSRYLDILKKHPGLVNNKEVWDAELGTALLLGSKEAMESLEEQESFFECLVNQMVEQAAAEELISSNQTNAYYRKIKEEIQCSYVNQPMEVIKGQISDILHNSFTTKNKEKLEAFNSAGPKQVVKWNKKSEWNPVDGMKEEIKVTCPEIANIFKGQENALAPYVLEAMKACPEVLKINPNIISFTNVEELGNLSYTEFSKSVRILLNNFNTSKETYTTLLMGLSPYAQKLVVSKLMSSVVVTKAAIEKVIDEAEKKEKQEKAALELKQNEVLSRIFSRYEIKKEFSYDYRNVRGTKMFAEKIFGVRVRYGDFKLNDRFENIVLAEKIWNEIDKAGITSEVITGILAGQELTDLIKCAGISKEDIKKCETELRLFGQGREIVGRGGNGETALLQYEDSDYKEGLKQFDSLGEDMLFIESYLDFKYGGKNADLNEKNKVRNRLRGIAAKFKPAMGLSEYESEKVLLENKERLGFATFKELVLKLNQTDFKDIKAGSEARDKKIEVLRAYKGGVLESVISYLVGNENFCKKLMDSGEADNTLAENTYKLLKPFMDASKEFATPGMESFIFDQYMFSNFDQVYEECQNKETTKEEWYAALSDYSKVILNTEIQGRGSINEILNDMSDRASRWHKFGSTIFYQMLTLGPGLIRKMVENPDDFQDMLKSYIENYAKNEKIIEEVLSEELPEKYRPQAKGIIIKNFGRNLYLSHRDNEEMKFRVELATMCNDYKMEAGKNATKYSEAVKKAEARMAKKDKRRQELDKKKKEGVEADTDLKALLELEEKQFANPYIYLNAKGLVKVRRGKDDAPTGYTSSEAKSCVKTVNDALKSMKHEGELPDGLIKFMAEVVFADRNMDVKQEVRYMIGLYRSLSIYYKYGVDRPAVENAAIENASLENAAEGEVDEEKAAEEKAAKEKAAEEKAAKALEDTIERAAIYHFVNNKRHTIPAGTKMLHKYRITKKAEDKNGANPQDPAQAPQNQAQAAQNQAQAAQAPLTQREKDDKRLEDFLGINIDHFNLDETQRKKILDELNKREAKALKEKEKAEKKKKKEAEKEKEKLEKLEEFELEHEEYMIPLFDPFAMHKKAEGFDKVYSLNQELKKKLETDAYTDPAIKAELKHFLKNIQISMYTMSPDEFTALVERRIKFYDYAQKVYDEISNSLKKYYQDLEETGELEGLDIDSVVARSMSGYRDYFRLQILRDIKNGTAFDAKIWQKKIDRIVNDEISSTVINSEKVSYTDGVFGEKAFNLQPCYDDVVELINEKASKKLRISFNNLSLQEKMIFVAALSVAKRSETAETTPFNDFVEKDGDDLSTMESLKKAIESFMENKQFTFQIDFKAAIKNLLDDSEEYLYGKTKLNEGAFNAALTIVEGAKAQQEEMKALPLEVLGDSKLSLDFAAKNHKIQALEAGKRRSKDINEFFYGNLFDMINKDLNASESSNLRIRANSTVHSFIEGVDKKKLAARLANLSSEEKKIFVMLLQDRTVLDFQSEKREERSAQGEIIGHVNETKRELIKAEYLGNANTRGRLLSPANSGGALDNAMKTLLSFQLRDGVGVTGSLETDYVDSSVNRNTLLDWELIKRAFEFMDELKGESEKQQIIANSNSFIEYSLNDKAIDLHKKHNAKNKGKNFEEKDFVEFFKNKELSDEMTEEHRDLIEGFEMLTDAQKILFFRALQNREILDISTKNSLKNVILGSEMNYVNAPKRYALIDEYIERSRSEFAAVDVTDNMQFNAINTLLSRQLDDSIDYNALGSSELKQKVALGQIFADKYRTTAIDWKLFENALQFVARAEEEKKTKYNDEAMMRTLGKFTKNGEFTFSTSFLRRNIYTSVSRTGAYTMSRIRAKVKEYIPDSGNLRTLMSHILSVNTMNSINNSGILGKPVASAADGKTAEIKDGAPGSMVERGMAEAEAQKLEKKVKTEAKALDDADNALTKAEKAADDAKTKFLSAQSSLKTVKDEYEKKLEKNSMTPEQKEAYEKKILELEQKLDKAREAYKKADEGKKEAEKTFNGLNNRTNERQKRINQLRGILPKADRKHQAGTEEATNTDTETEITEEDFKDATKAVRGKFSKSTNLYSDRLVIETNLDEKQFDSTTLETELANFADLTKNEKKGCGVSSSFLKYKDKKVLIIDVASLHGLDEKMYEALKEEAEKVNKKIEKQAKDKYGELNETQLKNIYASNSGLEQYAAMTEVLKEMLGDLKLGGEQKDTVNKQIAALAKASADISKMLTLFKSDKTMAEKLAMTDLDSVMGLAILEGEEFGYKEEMATVKKHYDNIKELKKTTDSIIKTVLTDGNLLLDTNLDGLITCISKYDSGEYYDVLKKTAKNSQNFAKKLSTAITNYSKNSADEAYGGGRDFFDPEKDIVEQLGIDSVFDMVADLASVDGGHAQVAEAVKKSKQLTIDAGKVVQQVLKNSKALDLIDFNIQKSRTKLEVDIAAVEKKIKQIGTANQETNALGEPLTEAELRQSIEELKEKQKEETEALEKAKTLANVTETEAILKAVNLADIGKMMSVFMSEENAQTTEKYSKMLNSIKDQAAELYKNVATSKDAKDFFKQFNLKNLSEAFEVFDNKTMKKTAKIVGSVSSIVQNGFNIILKNTVKSELKLGDVIIRKQGETRTQKLNSYGELENRSATEVLNQIGVDEAFEIAKIISIADSSGKSLKYVSATQELKTEVAKMVDNVNKVIKDGSYENIKAVTDIDGCIKALNSIIDTADDTGRTKELREGLEKALKVKSDIVGIFDTMRQDGDFFENLNKLSVDGLLDLVSGADKNTTIGALRDIVKETKTIYNATYGIYKQGEGLLTSLKMIGRDGTSDKVKDMTDTIFGKLKENKVIGKKVESLYNSGALTKTVKAGMVVKENVQSFMNIIDASKGIYTLRKNTGELDLAIEDMQDIAALKKAKDAQDKLVTDESMKLSKAEQDKIDEAKDRNKFMTGQGIDYAYVDHSTQLINAAGSIAGSVSSVTFDPTGISKTLINEVAQFVSYVVRVLKDDSAMKDYFVSGPGKSYMQKLRIKRIADGRSFDDDTLVAVARRHLGMSDDMEFRTYVGRNIVSAILFSASEFNPLKGTKTRAQAVLKSIKLADLIGKTDEGSSLKLYNALIGNYGLDIGEVTKGTKTATGDAGKSIYGHLKTVNNGVVFA